MKKAALLMPALFALMLQGCSESQVRRDLDSKIAAEPPIRGHAELFSEADRLIRTAPGLSQDQRELLTKTRTTLQEESDLLRKRSIKLRSLLVKNLLSSQYNRDDAEIIKDEIREVENQRLSLLIRGVHKTNLILGRWESRNSRETELFYDQILWEQEGF